MTGFTLIIVLIAIVFLSDCIYWLKTALSSKKPRRRKDKKKDRKVSRKPHRDNDEFDYSPNTDEIDDLIKEADKSFDEFYRNYDWNAADPLLDTSELEYKTKSHNGLKLLGVFALGAVISALSDDSDEFVLNKRSGTIHSSWDDSADTISDHNKRKISSYEADELVRRGSKYHYKK